MEIICIRIIGTSIDTNFKMHSICLDFRMDIFEDLELLYDPVLELIDDVIPDRGYGLRPRTDHFNKWNDDEFYNRFRLSKPTVEFILQQIGRDLQNRTEW